jgi:hypothetical protein
MLYRLKTRFATAVLFASFPLAGLIAMAQLPENAPRPPKEPVVSFSQVVGNTGSALVLGQPYTLREKITLLHRFASGQTTNLVSQENQMRDSAGRVRIEIGHMQDGNLAVDAIEIRDQAARTIVVLTPSNSTAHLSHLPVVQSPDPGQPALDQPTNQTDQPPALRTTVDKLSPQSVAGVLTEGTRTTSIIPIGTGSSERDITVVTECWRSPELKIVLRMTQDDPRKDMRTEEVTELQRSEPNPALFHIPSDYTVIDDNTGETISQ